MKAAVSSEVKESRPTYFKFKCVVNVRTAFFLNGRQILLNRGAWCRQSPQWNSTRLICMGFTLSAYTSVSVPHLKATLFSVTLNRHFKLISNLTDTVHTEQSRHVTAKKFPRFNTCAVTQCYTAQRTVSKSRRRDLAAILISVNCRFPQSQVSASEANPSPSPRSVPQRPVPVPVPVPVPAQCLRDQSQSQVSASETSPSLRSVPQRSVSVPVPGQSLRDQSQSQSQVSASEISPSPSPRSVPRRPVPAQCLRDQSQSQLSAPIQTRSISFHIHRFILVFPLPAGALHTAAGSHGTSLERQFPETPYRSVPKVGPESEILRCVSKLSHIGVLRFPVCWSKFYVLVRSSLHQTLSASHSAWALHRTWSSPRSASQPPSNEHQNNRNQMILIISYLLRGLFQS
jgi:hypothetical protein